MKFVTCTFAPASRNEHRTYFVRLNKYAVVRETACFFYVLDEMGYERRVSKKTSCETGYKANHAAEFSEIMEQAEAVDTQEAAAARRQYAAFTAAEKTEAEAMNAATVSRRDAIETMIDSMDDAISDRDILTARAWKADIKAAVEADHVEALEEDAQRQMDKPAFRAFWAASEFSAMATAVQAFDAVHAEALTINEEIDAIVAYAGEAAPLQLNGDINWIFDTAVSVWQRRALVSEAIRTANRNGHWITGAQVAAMLADGKIYSPEQLATAVINQAKEAEQLEQYGAQLTTAQQDYNTAQLASVAALDAACAASIDGTEDTPEFAAYESAEAALMGKTTALLQACGRYSVELARRLGKSVSDIESLKQMFMPAMTGQIESYHPGRRNELVSKALQIDVNATQAR